MSDEIQILLDAEDALTELAKPISAVYSGLKNHCACGCAGTHSSTSRSINVVRGKIAKALADQDFEPGSIQVWPDVFVSLKKGTRMYIAYTDGRDSS